MSIHPEQDRMGLSPEGERRREEILGAISTELGRVVRRRRAVRAAVVSGGFAACGLAMFLAARWPWPSHTPLTGTPGIAQGMPPPDRTGPTTDPQVHAFAPPAEEVERPAPAITMTSARFEIVGRGIAPMRAEKVNDSALIALAAEAGLSASIIRGSDGGILVLDNASGKPLATEVPAQNPDPTGSAPDAESHIPRRAV